MQLLDILESLFSQSSSCIEWYDVIWFDVFQINFGVRQGSV